MGRSGEWLCTLYTSSTSTQCLFNRRLTPLPPSKRHLRRRELGCFALCLSHLGMAGHSFLCLDFSKAVSKMLNKHLLEGWRGGLVPVPTPRAHLLL